MAGAGAKIRDNVAWNWNTVWLSMLHKILTFTSCCSKSINYFGWCVKSSVGSRFFFQDPDLNQAFFPEDRSRLAKNLDTIWKIKDLIYTYFWLLYSSYWLLFINCFFATCLQVPMMLLQYTNNLMVFFFIKGFVEVADRLIYFC